MNQQLTPFTPPSLQPSKEDADVAKLLGVEHTTIEVANWRPMAVKLLMSSSSRQEIALLVRRPIEEVEAFLNSPNGRQMVKDAVDERPARLDKLLAGSRVDTILALQRVRASGKSESAVVAACGRLLELENEAMGKAKDPEQVKREAEERLKKREADRLKQKNQNEA